MSLALKSARSGPRGYRNRSAIVKGDPGLFGGLIGAVKGAGGAVLRGGNPITGAIGGAVSGFRGAPLRMTGPAMPVMPGTGASGGFGRFNPPFAGAPGVGLVSPRGAVSVSAYEGVGMKVACPSGYHPNKTGYYVAGGQYVAPGSKCVKNQRKNPGNARATSRAITRIKGAKRMAKALGKISIREK